MGRAIDRPPIDLPPIDLPPIDLPPIGRPPIGRPPPVDRWRIASGRIERSTSKPEIVSRAIGLRSSDSISFRRPSSSTQTSDTASPSIPARPVRPIRCT
jgi:hypothetical protein